MAFLLSAAVTRRTGRKATSALLNSFAAAAATGGLQMRTTKNGFSTTTTAFNVDMNSPPDPLPYVAAPYSYAFGRSQHELQYKTIGQILDERVAEDKGIPKIISHYENIEKTFTELKEDADRIARALYEELGLKRGDVLALWGNNSYNWITIQYACARVGVILCTINPYYQKGELMYALKKGGVKALFMPGSGSPQEVVSQFGKILAEGLASDRTKEGEDELILEHLVTIDGASYDAFPGTKRPLKMHTLAKLKQNSSPVLDRAVTDVVSPDDTAIIMFTSGTTGKPKGAYLSHFTMVNNARLCNYAFTRDHGDDIAFLVPLPYFHSFAATFGCIASTAADFKMITPSMKYNVEELVAAIQKHKASHMIATPTLVIDLKDFIGRTKQQVPSLKCVISGGASMPVETAKEFLKTVPSVTDFRIGYGATELGPASTLSKGWHSFENRIQTIGTPCDFVELKVINPVTKEAVKLGETGEICSRGYNTMIGYWKDPVKTKEAIDRAGWYNTGDLGVMDEGGYLKIVGRSKEMIIVGGENVYPREIEEVLHTHPAILDVYVVGVPDPRKGEVGCAWIKLVDKNAPISEEELKKFCQDNLAYFKVPKYYLFVDEFPTTSVGKAKKFVMREITVKKLGLTENK